jgi:hypothetical protein
MIGDDQEVERAGKSDSSMPSRFPKAPASMDRDVWRWVSPQSSWLGASPSPSSRAA